MKYLGIVLVLVVGAAGCDAPEPGDIVYDFQAPDTGDGAFHFTYTAPVGDEIGTMTAVCTGCQLFIHRVAPHEVRGVVVSSGAIPMAAVLRVSVSDVRDPTLYTAQVKQVAMTTNVVRSGLAGYSLVPVR